MSGYRWSASAALDIRTSVLIYHPSILSQQQQLPRLHLLANLQPIQINSRSQRPPSVIPTIPTERVDPGFARTIDERGHLLAGQVVNDQSNHLLLRQTEADRGGAVEGIWIVLRQTEHLRCSIFLPLVHRSSH